jgi:hypothetical protein
VSRDVWEWDRRWKRHGMTLVQFRAWLCSKTEKGREPLSFPESMYPRYMRR